ncbi:hypothetical protein JHK85_029108 [Glycine max]|nr:hypothetical protein JHK85_029108 [Glycine max]
MGKARSVAATSGRILNEAVSFVAFCVLDLVDFLLCFVFKAVDLWVEAEFRPCYCSSAKEAITSSGKILVSEQGGESKIVSLLSSTKLQLEDISDTLYSRPSLVSEVSRLTINELKRLKLEDPVLQSKRGNSRCSTFTVNTTIVEMLQDGLTVIANYAQVGSQLHPLLMIIPPMPKPLSLLSPNAPSQGNNKMGFYKLLGGKELNEMMVSGECNDVDEGGEDVVFIHGFISSSLFWSETVFPNMSSAAKSCYRLFAVDLLGFGRSPKPSESLYTLREHLEMIERSVLEAHKPFYPVPKGETQATQYVMRKVAPRRVWPPMAFGASLACWYEHITRVICLLICKNHRLWEFLAKLITRNRVRTFLLEGFFCHTHNAAWHTLHNIICGTAGKIGSYLEAVRENRNCKVTIFHGKNDEVIPVECSYEVQKRIPRAQVRVIDNKDHITIVVGRQKAFARELEEIWGTTTTNHN